MFRCKELNFFVFTCLFKSLLADLVVNTSSGPIRGTSSFAENVEAFLGVPYAEPPVGELRFAKPVPKKQWDITYDAFSLPPPCPQTSEENYYFLPDITNMSEDCLYLNIWMPKSKPTDNLRPVIVFIHPGAFLIGSSSQKVFDGSNFANRGDVIVVTINYRLGTLGYFLSYTEEAEGNMGMYDQILAISWMKENARVFSGDPQNIVLMGVSAGAWSVSAHMVSPLSKHLFRRAIVESGSAVIRIMMDNNTALYENSQLLASHVGCSNDTTNLVNDPHSVMKCLKNTPIKDIIEAEKNIFFLKSIIYYPRMNDEFFPKSPVDLFREGKFRKDIDVLTGITENEGALLLISSLQEYFGHYGEDVIDISKARANVLSQALLLRLKDSNSKEVAKYYMSQVTNRTSIEYAKMIADIVGDFLVSCSTLFLADFLSLKGNAVYFYKFDYRTASTPMADWVGTTHLDEVQYVFGNPFHDNFTNEQIELSHNLIDRWSAFAKSGNPNIPGRMPWLRYSYHNPLYLNFGQEEESIRMKPNKRCEIWRNRFNAQIPTELIRSLRNSGMNITNSNFT